jgi:twitching motility two-component system response regulator PilG
MVNPVELESKAFPIDSLLTAANESNSPSGQPPGTALGAGTAAVVAPSRVLRNVIERSVSGQLLIRDAANDSVAWMVYVSEGQLLYATSLQGELDRLIYLLKRTRSTLIDYLPEQLPGTLYDFLTSEWKSGQLDLGTLRILLRIASQDALVHILATPQVAVQFDRQLAIEPMLSMEFKEAILPLSASVTAWQQFRPTLHSPFQRLRVLDGERFYRELGDNLQAIKGPNSPSTIEAAIALQPSLYGLAARLDTDLLQLSGLLFQATAAGLAMMEPFERPAVDSRPTIACIDDSTTVQRNVKLILEAAGFRVLSLTNPLLVLSALVTQNPVLILMDITMPDMDGYELCRLLRQSSSLRDTPVVMLSGRDGFVDKVRARVVGAVDYITKPFDAKALMDTVNKYAQKAIVS